ncbi:MAG: phosphotransferase [Acidobacteriota bacterium]
MPLRAARSLSLSEEYPVAQAGRVASIFSLPRPIESYDFPDKGNINRHTYLITAGPDGAKREYLLQRINQQVFTRPWSVMASMLASIEAQQQCLARGELREGEEWETITLIPTQKGKPFLELTDRRGYSCWRLMVKIPETRTFKSLSEIREESERLRIAEQAGSGLALYGSFTAGMDVCALENPLPGYRDTRLYYNQLLSVLAENRSLESASPYLPEDPLVRQSTEQHFLVHLPESEYRGRVSDPALAPFIELARENEEYAMTLLKEMESGKIRKQAIHGDTKLDNFLFSTRSGRVRALVDLDTIMPHTWLVDWGDMVRSLVNVAGEKETQLSRVAVDLKIYEAVARGFLRSARAVRREEVARMADAVQIIALELGIRFLADYLRGDSYFKLGPADPPDLNKTRAMVQLTLFKKLTEAAEKTRRCIEEIYARHCAG